LQAAHGVSGAPRRDGAEVNTFAHFLLASGFAPTDAPAMAESAQGPGVKRGWRRFPRLLEMSMSKGDQRSNKMDKKPKKDTAPPKQIASDRPMPPTTTVLPRGKEKKKLS
jgi:hypothetical protein